ncbi:flagellar motor protein MotB [Halotalea alkalilenta]|uniref:flagellar motor protein MotB n=1 Tax=Halotalea alkalilenta TaxID=376489 RepID=UPI0007D04590|nr:flagellar motor protein MotB [Halotalea alkalilenta]
MSAPRRKIIRRGKQAHGSHGSWKIAYADFMTAMMAFFLVMWLLSGVSAAQLEGINEYFRTPLTTSLAGGERSAMSPSVIPGGGDDPIHLSGEVALVSRVKTDGDDARRLDPATRRALARLTTVIQQDPALSALGEQLLVEVIDQGIRIQIIDGTQSPMFQLGSAEITPRMRRVLDGLAPLLAEAPHGITLTGHTDDLPYASGPAGYGNWELSTERANASRRELMRVGLPEPQLLRVTGMAATMNLSSISHDPINRRISIVLLSEQARASIDGERRTIERGEGLTPEQLQLDQQQPLSLASDMVAQPRPLR